MPDYNIVVLVGRLTRDPELKATKANATPFTELSLAVNKSVKRPDGSWQKQVSFFDIVVWKHQAENCCKYLHKGSSILVSGELEQQRWTSNDGRKNSKVKVRASKVQFLDPKGVAAAPEAETPADGFDGSAPGEEYSS